MTVTQLIDALELLPSTYEVFTIYDTGHSFPLVTNVVVVEEHKVVLIQDVNGEKDRTYLENNDYPNFDRYIRK